ncbi:TRAP transporter small permease [Pararhodobacter sp.]|uniref:TRAP transporter small permease n=1 Tax=Pararhodobacter sp. TaxID=2127056 RepID=UPI002AFF10A8|nr:TRAP transporter small permease [Pararhodobacter sp.]
MHKLGDGLIRAADGVAILALTAMILQVGATILLRELAGIGISGAAEMVAKLYMPLIVFGALAGHYHAGAEIRVDLIAHWLPPGALRLLDRLIELVLALTAGALAWKTAGLAARALRIGERIEIGSLAIPGWPGKMAVTAGFALLALAALIRLFRGGRHVPR